jgi:hypothetical protein
MEEIFFSYSESQASETHIKLAKEDEHTAFDRVLRHGCGVPYQMAERPQVK